MKKIIGKHKWMGLGLGWLLSFSALWASPFEDLPQEHWAYQALEELEASGVLHSLSNRLTEESRLNRYEFASLVYEAISRTESGYRLNPQAKEALNRLQAEFAQSSRLLQQKSLENEKEILILNREIEARGAPAPRVLLLGQAMFSAIHASEGSPYGTSNGSTQSFQVDSLKLGIQAELDEQVSFYATLLVNPFGSARLGGKAGDLSLEEAFYLKWESAELNARVRAGRQWLPWGNTWEGELHTPRSFASHSLVESLHSGIFQGLLLEKQVRPEWSLGFGLHDGYLKTMPDQTRAFWPAASLELPGLNTMRNSLNQPLVATVPVEAFQQGDLIEDGGTLVYVSRETEDRLFKWQAGWFQAGDGLKVSGGVPNAAAGRAEMNFYNLGLAMRPSESMELSAEYVEGSRQNYIRSDMLDAAGRMDSFLYFPGTPGNGRVVEDDFRTFSVQAVMALDEASRIGVRYGSLEVLREGTQAPSPLNEDNFDDVATEMTFSVSRKVTDSGTLILEYSTLELEKSAGRLPSGLRRPGVLGQDNQSTVRASYRIEF